MKTIGDVISEIDAVRCNLSKWEQIRATTKEDRNEKREYIQYYLQKLDDLYKLEIKEEKNQ